MRPRLKLLTRHSEKYGCVGLRNVLAKISSPRPFLNGTKILMTRLARSTATNSQPPPAQRGFMRIRGVFYYGSDGVDDVPGELPTRLSKDQ
jgi:hypothetical protein